MEGRLPYDDFPVVFLPPYESPPAWVPPHEVREGSKGGVRLGRAQLGAAPQARRFVLQRVYHPDYNNELTQFLPRTVVLKKPPGAQVRLWDPAAALTGSLLTSVWPFFLLNSRCFP